MLIRSLITGRLAQYMVDTFVVKVGSNPFIAIYGRTSISFQNKLLEGVCLLELWGVTEIFWWQLPG